MAGDVPQINGVSVDHRLAEYGTIIELFPYLLLV